MLASVCLVFFSSFCFTMRFFFAITFLLLMTLCCKANILNKNRPNVSIITDSASYNTILFAINEHIKRFSTISFSLEYGSPQYLLNIIKNGEAANILFTNNNDLIYQAKQLGFLDTYSTYELFYDSPVLFTEHGNNFITENESDINQIIEKILDAGFQLFVPDINKSATGRVIKSTYNTDKRIEEIISNKNLKLISNEWEIPYLVTNDCKKCFGITEENFITQYANTNDIRIVSRLNNESQRLKYTASVIVSKEMLPSRQFLEFLRSDNVVKEIMLDKGMKLVYD